MMQQYTDNLHDVEEEEEEYDNCQNGRWWYTVAFILTAYIYVLICTVCNNKSMADLFLRKAL